MNGFRFLFSVIAIAVVLCGECLAVDFTSSDPMTNQKELFGISDLEQYLPEEARQVWGDFTVEQSIHQGNRLDQLREFFSQNLGELLRAALQNVLMMIIICLLIACGQTFLSRSPHKTAFEITGALAISMLGAVQVNACVPEGIRIAEALSAFSTQVLPVLSAAATASGAITSAGAKYVIAATALSLFGAGAETVLLPALYLFAAASITGCVLQNELLMTLAGLMKRVLRLLLIATAALFTAYLGLTGILNGAADAAAAKAAKAAISTALPVVGGIMADAADTLTSGAALLCSGVGIFGVLCTAAICLLPYASFALHYLLYQAAAELCTSFSAPRINSLLRCFSDLYGMLLGILGTLSFIIFASIVSIMRAAGKG